MTTPSSCLIRCIVPGLVWQDERGLYQPVVTGWAFGPALGDRELAEAVAEAETERRRETAQTKGLPASAVSHTPTRSAT
jgi:hypothetical protein